MKRVIPKNWRAKLISVLFVRLTLENWRAKLISLLLATMLWYLIKKNVATTTSPSERPSGTPITETR
jgi:YbbR domain-containing protein